MSFQVMTWAVNQKLPATLKIVLLMLANRTNNDTGRCDPSMEKLADDCGLSIRSTRESIRKLEVLDLIETIQCKDDSGTTNLPNKYLLKIRQNVGVRQEVPGGGTAGGAGGVRQEVPTKQEYKPGNIRPEPKSIPIAPNGSIGQPTLNAQIWDAYSKAYFGKYGAEPVRNAKVNAQISQLGKRLGVEAISVAGWFCFHNNQLYVQAGHCIDLLLRDAEKLRTEWATGRKITSTRANQIDKTQTNYDSFAPLIEKARQHEEKENAK